MLIRSPTKSAPTPSFRASCGLSNSWGRRPLPPLKGVLWVNEIPDYEADLKTGRRHGVILLGKRKAAVFYVLFLFLAYLFIIIPVAMGILPALALLGLLTIPVAIKASQGALKNYDDTEKLIPTLGQNVLVVLVTPVLMTIGLLIATLL